MYYGVWGPGDQGIASPGRSPRSAGFLTASATVANVEQTPHALLAFRPVLWESYRLL